MNIYYLPLCSPSMCRDGQSVKILENMKMATDAAIKVCQAVIRPARILMREMNSPDTMMCSDTNDGFRNPVGF